MHAKWERRLTLKILAKQRPPCREGTNKIPDDIAGHCQCQTLFTIEHLQRGFSTSSARVSGVKERQVETLIGLAVPFSQRN